MAFEVPPHTRSESMDTLRSRVALQFTSAFGAAVVFLSHGIQLLPHHHLVPYVRPRLLLVLAGAFIVGAIWAFAWFVWQMRRRSKGY
jgi:hypothetical protein